MLTATAAATRGALLGRTGRVRALHLQDERGARRRHGLRRHWLIVLRRRRRRPARRLRLKLLELRPGRVGDIAAAREAIEHRVLIAIVLRNVDRHGRRHVSLAVRLPPVVDKGALLLHRLRRLWAVGRERLDRDRQPRQLRRRDLAAVVVVERAHEPITIHRRFGWRRGRLRRRRRRIGLWRTVDDLALLLLHGLLAGWTGLALWLSCRSR